jgi:hypothetical protein
MNMHPKKAQGLGLGLRFQLFEYFGFGLGILQISKYYYLKYKKNLVLGYGSEYQF